MSARQSQLWQRIGRTLRRRVGRFPTPALMLALIAVVVIEAGGLALYLGQARTAAANAIQIENSYPGDPTWDDFASVEQHDAISGYGSQISINRGESIDFFVTTTAPSLTIDIFRTGWYGGAGARKMASLGSFPGVRQPIPPPDPETGKIECKWAKTATLNVPATWTTGIYLAKLTASNGNKSFIFFVVRNDGGAEDLVYQASVTTYQAYNAWGGISLYTNNTNQSVYPHNLATKVSFDRPFDPSDSNGAGHYLYTEYYFVRWAEAQGYNLTYTTDIDTHTNVNPLTNHKGFLSVGHDEYWTKGMRDNVERAVGSGVNAAFFGANSAYWQIRLEPNAAGTPNRVQVCYKDQAVFDQAPGPDPLLNVDNSVVTTRWRDAPVNRPENGLLGVMYEDQVERDYAYVVQNAAHWVYAGTGFVNGSKVPGIVGYEYDKVWNNGATPAGLTVLSSSPVVGCCEGSGNSTANSAIYTAPSGARVFAAGTINWSLALDSYNGNALASAGLKRMTANLLNNFIGGGTTTPPTPTSTPVAPTPTNTPVLADRDQHPDPADEHARAAAADQHAGRFDPDQHAPPADTDEYAPPPTPTATPTSGAALVLYDNAFRNGFSDGSFSTIATNPCDTTTYTSPTCSYALTPGPYGALSFRHAGANTGPYARFEFTVRLNGQPITNYVAAFYGTPRQPTRGGGARPGPRRRDAAQWLGARLGAAERAQPRQCVGGRDRHRQQPIIAARQDQH